jgi:PPOX class probable FMN-dependent enzyme
MKSLAVDRTAEEATPMNTTGLVEITSEQELVDLVGAPAQRVADKVRTSLHEVDRAWLARSPFCLVATSGADGNCDVSPKGDPPGFTLVLDDTTVVVPDRPGNRRVDGFRNVLANPHVGLLYLLPGRGDTLRINGRARLVRDAPFFDDMVVKGNRPALAMVVDVEEVFYHCSKAFLRSQLWQTESWRPDAVPNRARISKAVERPDDPIEVLETYYGPTYGAKLYG